MKPKDDLDVLLACSLAFSSHLRSILLEEMGTHNLYIHYRAALLPLLSSSSNAGARVNGLSHTVTRRESFKKPIWSSKSVTGVWYDQRDATTGCDASSIQSVISNHLYKGPSPLYLRYYHHWSLIWLIHATIYFCFQRIIHTPHTTYTLLPPSLPSLRASMQNFVREKKNLFCTSPLLPPLFACTRVYFYFCI